MVINRLYTHTHTHTSLTPEPHSFSSQAKEQYQKLGVMHSNMNMLFQNMLEFFAVDPKKTSVDELFTDLSNFRAMFVVSALASCVWLDMMMMMINVVL